MDQLKLKECFIYNELTGDFVWKVRPKSHFKNQRYADIWNNKFSGKVAGTTYKPSKNSSYKRKKIVINNKQIMSHQAAWIITNGDIPFGKFIDHIDGNATNNSLSNLRLVTHSENHRNRKIQSNNTSGTPGIRLKGNKWYARVKINNKEIYLGSFNIKEDAIKRRKEYAIENGFTERHHTDRG